MSTTRALQAPRKRARPVQAIALVGCCLVLAMTVIAVANGLAGHAPWPERLEPPAVILHLVTATAALPLTILQLARRKGDRPHRMIGYVWCALLLGGALVSFFVHEMTGGFSPPHVFAIGTVIMVPWIIYAAHT